MLVNEERQEIFREHLVECLAHFSKLFNSKFPQGKRGRYKAFKPMADFCGVGTKTAREWLDCKSSPPKGESLIKLTCYLDLHGYRVIEFERLPKVVRNFSELIGFSILSAEEAARLLGYHDSQEIYYLFRDKRSMSKEKENRAWSVWKSKRDELEGKKKHALNHSCLEFVFKSPTPEQIEQRVLAMSEPACSVSSRRSATLCIMRGLLILLDEGLFKSLSESEIDVLDQNDVLHIVDLSVHFSTMSSKLMRMKKE